MLFASAKLDLTIFALVPFGSSTEIPFGFSQLIHYNPVEKATTTCLPLCVSPDQTETSCFLSKKTVHYNNLLIYATGYAIQPALKFLYQTNKPIVAVFENPELCPHAYTILDAFFASPFANKTPFIINATIESDLSDQVIVIKQSKNNADAKSSCNILYQHLKKNAPKAMVYFAEHNEALEDVLKLILNDNFNGTYENLKKYQPDISNNNNGDDEQLEKIKATVDKNRQIIYINTCIKVLCLSFFIYTILLH